MRVNIVNNVPPSGKQFPRHTTSKKQHDLKPKKKLAYSKSNRYTGNTFDSNF